MFDFKKIFLEKTDKEIAEFLMTKRISKRKSTIRKKITGADSQAQSLAILVKSFLTSEAVMKNISNIFGCDNMELNPEIIANHIVSLLPYKSDNEEVAYDKCLYLAAKLRLFFSAIYEGANNQKRDSEAMLN